MSAKIIITLSALAAAVNAMPASIETVYITVTPTTSLFTGFGPVVTDTAPTSLFTGFGPVITTPTSLFTGFGPVVTNMNSDAIMSMYSSKTSSINDQMGSAMTSSMSSAMDEMMKMQWYASWYMSMNEGLTTVNGVDAETVTMVV